MENLEESELSGGKCHLWEEAHLRTHSRSTRDSRDTVQLDSLHLEHLKRLLFFARG